MAVLVLLVHEAGRIKTPSRAAVAAAASLGDIHALVAGADTDSAAQAAARLPGVARVLRAEAPALAHPLAEPLAALLVSLAPGYSHILAGADAIGKNVIPRAAALLDSQPISDVCAVIDADHFVRPIYAGNALAHVHSADAIKFITIRAASFDAVAETGGSADIHPVTLPELTTPAHFLRAELSTSARPELPAARVVVSGGRGIGSAANFALLDPVADLLGAAVGASRAAVDAGYIGNDSQVGQTGKIVAPELYIAVGISGAIQHLAGMKDSKVIVAINKDAEAPIFQVADFGLVADLFTTLPALAGELARSKAEQA